MRKEWILEYSDFLAAQQLHNRGSWRRYFLFGMLWVLPAFAILFAVLFMSILISEPSRAWASFPGFAPVVIVAIAYRLCYQNALRQGYKRMFLNGSPSKPVYFEIDEERVVSGVPGSSEGRFPWAAVSRCSENEKVALLYVSMRNFLIIPKTKLQPQEWLDLRSELAIHLKGIER